MQQQLQQTRVRARETEQVTTELVEQMQLQLDTRTEELQHLRTEKEQLSTEKEQLQTANARADEQIRLLHLQVSDIIIIILQVLFDLWLQSHRSNNNSS